MKTLIRIGVLVGLLALLPARLGATVTSEVIDYATFVALGHLSTVALVIYTDDVPNAAFQAVLTYPAVPGVVFTYTRYGPASISQKPATFATDFPAAIRVATIAVS